MGIAFLAGKRKPTKSTAAARMGMKAKKAWTRRLNFFQ
jgi:hypothetical protein